MIGKLLLLVIVALGIGLAVPKTRPRLVNPIMNRINQKIVPQRLENIAAQLDQMLLRGEQLPSGNWEGWIEAYTTQPARDPWGNVYYLDRKRDGYTLGSMGPDRTKGTADDMTVQRTHAARRR